MIFKIEGFIEVICGPMFSGKTTELIRRIEFLKSYNIKFLVFKHSIDKRYSGKAEITTHDLKFYPSLLINRSEEILNFVEKDTEIIVIDETQFFDDGIKKILNDLSYRGINIIIGGLENDFCGRPFGAMPYLLSIADKVTKLNTFCSVCGKIATRTQRIANGQVPTQNDPIILVGTNNSHESRCRKCHKFI